MEYKAGLNYVTQKAFMITLPKSFAGIFVHLPEGWIADRTLHINAGYPWDGASFPLFKYTGTPDWLKVPSAVHDFGYWCMNQSKMPLSFRIHWDAFFRQLAEERVFPKWPRWLRKPIARVAGGVCYGLVRLFGNYCARHGRKVMEVA